MITGGTPIACFEEGLVRSLRTDAFATLGDDLYRHRALALNLSSEVVKGFLVAVGGDGAVPKRALAKRNRATLTNPCRPRPLWRKAGFPRPQSPLRCCHIGPQATGAAKPMDSIKKQCKSLGGRIKVPLAKFDFGADSSSGCGETSNKKQLLKAKGAAPIGTPWLRI